MNAIACSYKENIDKMADLLDLERHDPLDDGIWLLEYVAKTKGAEHLKSGARHLHIVQYLGIDLMAFGALVAYIVSSTVKSAFRRLKVPPSLAAGKRIKVE